MAATGSSYHGGGHQVHWRVADGGEMTAVAAEALERLRSAWVSFFLTVDLPAACVYCGGEVVWWNGRRRRGATVLVAGVVAYLSGIWCRRVKCGSKGCGGSWTLRPEGMMPRRQYQLSVVADGMSLYLLGGESTQEEIADRLGCSRWTVGKWVRWVSEVAEPSALARRVLEASGEPVLPRVDVAVRRGWERMLEVVRRAAENLGLMEALASAQGLVPPGLQSVVGLLVRGRDRVTTYTSPIIPEVSA